MTQITRKSVPMRGLILLLTVTLGAGLVLSGCGDDTPATTPAPAPPPPPPPPTPTEPEPTEPEAPATPTGFHVDVSQTSLSWHWNAVEGAIGYVVQVSTDEMFDDTDTITPTAETSFTVADLAPQTTLYARVRSAAGTLEDPVLSAWTTHVTGTTAMPPPPPPPPTAPATPTGLMSETGEGSITWSWDAVEGAGGYAVQVSMDEMFDEMDEIVYTTETSHSVSELGYSETRFARVASTSGEGDDMLMSMWTTHMTGMSMAAPPPPMAPAAPSGLMSETGDGSITWSWNAVDGADGYAIQVSPDEVFDDMDEPTYTAETTHTASDLGYGATRYARVASTSGEGDDMLMSSWTPHKTGMSMMKPVPVLPALEAKFMLSDMAKEPTYLITVSDKYKDDKEKATATVNRYIVVESNHYPVAITADLDGDGDFTDEESTQQANDGTHRLFKDFIGTVKQKMVVEDGVTFMVQRAPVGANQEMEPSDHVVYVTCNPFECMTGKDRPEYVLENSTACNMWEPDLKLQVGLVDNDKESHTGTAAVDADGVAEVHVFDGLDLGWTYKSRQKFNATHDVAVLSAKQGDSDGFAASVSSYKPLEVRSIGEIALGAGDAAAGEAFYAISVEGEPAAIADSDAARGSCIPLVKDAAAPAGVWAYSENLRSQISRPDNCFRITVDEELKRNYLDVYSVTLSPLAANVTWGDIAWPEFKELKCDGEPFKATDQVNVCDLFEEELDRALDEGWNAATHAYTQEGEDASKPLTLKVNADPKGTRRQFAALWFDHDSDGKNFVDFYVSDDEDTADVNEAAMIVIDLLDEDGDPKYGDIGKVDNTKPDGDDDDTDPDDGSDGKADNYLGTSDAGCTDDDGGTGASLCDAKHTFGVDVAFNAGLGAICEDVERTLSVTCEWDAQGEIRRGRDATAAEDTLQDADGDNSASFLSCTVKSP